MLRPSECGVSVDRAEQHAGEVGGSCSASRPWEGVWILS